MPARARARAQAMLPVTSSSNRRRSKRNDLPNSKAAGSGAPSNRPDQRVVIEVERERRLPADDTAIAFEQFQPDDTRHPFLNLVDERVERLAERSEPEPVVDGVGVLQA